MKIKYIKFKYVFPSRTSVTASHHRTGILSPQDSKGPNSVREVSVYYGDLNCAIQELKFLTMCSTYMCTYFSENINWHKSI